MIAKFLEGTETIAIVVLLTVLSWRLAPSAAGNVYVLQVFRACSHEGSIVGGLFLHVPEVAHALHALAVGIASDGSCIGNEAHVEALAAVQGLQNDGCAALQGELSKLVELFAEVVAGVHGVGTTRLLTVEGGHHDDATRVNLACSLDDFAHCTVELVLLSVFCEDESVEAGTDGSHADIASLQCIVYLVHTTGQAASAHLEACYAQALAVVELLLKCVANGDAFLEAEVEGCVCTFLLVLLGGTRSQHRAGGQRSRSCTGHRAYKEITSLHYFSG